LPFGRDALHALETREIEREKEKTERKNERERERKIA
jgi:hypothetical protein